METMRCPYCESKVLLSDVETDDGTCPECGAPLVGSLLFDQPTSEHDDDDDDAAGFGAPANRRSKHNEDDDIDLDEE